MREYEIYFYGLLDERVVSSYNVLGSRCVNEVFLRDVITFFFNPIFKNSFNL